MPDSQRIGIMRLLVETARMNRCKRLERKLCKAVSKFMHKDITCVLKYGEMGGERKDDSDA